MAYSTRICSPARRPQACSKWGLSADRLSWAAPHALLKTLEEPPAGGIIILVTSNVGALPPTVISRCRTVSFGFLDDGEVEEVLVRQGWDAGEAAAAAHLAEGSPGTVLTLGDEARKRATALVDKVTEAVGGGSRSVQLGLVEGLSTDRAEGELLVSLLLGRVRREYRLRLGGRGLSSSAEGGAAFGRMTAEPASTTRKI